jgi:hypothetical protein
MTVKRVIQAKAYPNANEVVQHLIKKLRRRGIEGDSQGFPSGGDTKGARSSNRY